MRWLARFLRELLCSHQWYGDWTAIVPRGVSLFRCRKCGARRVIGSEIR